MRRLNAKRQAAYTLIELLVVLAIISLLIGLLLPAVQKIRGKGTELQARHEIGQMELAIGNFRSTYGDIKAPPTCMWLSSDYGQVTAAQSPALNESRQYYARVWPKAFITPGQWSTPANYRAGFTMLPPNPLPFAPPAKAMNLSLDGNQLLVLLLGGVPSPNGATPAAWGFGGNRTGFYNSPTNPFNYDAANTKQCYAPNDGGVAKGPFFDFDPRRVDDNGHYHDVYWRNPGINDPAYNNNIYYYFAARNGNDYNAFGAIYANPADPFAISGITSQGGYGGGLNVNPYIGPDGRFLKFDSFQIISPGANGLPGPGGVFTPGQAPYADTSVGGDDQANFSGRLLQAPLN